jgi:hypothetical protein
MGVIAPDHVLTGDQRGNPVVWLAGPLQLPRMPDVSDAALLPAFGEGRGRKLKSWGHMGEYGAHWLITRSGTPLHNDPAYPRYSHHLIVRNDGFRLTGLGDPAMPPLVPGMIYCLDAHSPHQVVADPRMATGRPLFKVQLAVDFDEPVSQELAWALLTPLLGTEPGTTAAEVARTAPAPRVRKSGQAPPPAPLPLPEARPELARWGLR